MRKKELQRQINIKNEYLQLIIDFGFDYDGCETIDSLQNLIDELRYYAKLALENNDKECIYMGINGEYNILKEEVKNS